MVELINPVVRRWIEDGKSDPDGFWGEMAKEHIDWVAPFPTASGPAPRASFRGSGRGTGPSCGSRRPSGGSTAG